MKIPVIYKKPTFKELEKQFDWIWSEYEEVKFESIEIDRRDGEKEMELFQIDGYKSTKEVLKLMDEAGFRPAIFEELISYEKTFPISKENNYIVALGSPFSGSDGGRRVPYLSWGGVTRGLGARWLGRDWDSDYRFLVLRKEFSALGASDTGNLKGSLTLSLLVRAVEAFLKVLKSE